MVGRWWKATTGRSELDLAEHINVVASGETAALTEVAALVHRELGTTTLASLLKPVPKWEYALRGIEQVAYETRKKKPKPKKAAAGPQKRLAWVLSVDEDGDLEAAPKEQRAFKNGKWSKGRAVALKRLHAQAARMDFLIEQDRAAAAEIVHNTHRWSHLPTYYLPAAGIHALAGHPFVFNEVGDPVEIVHRDPELTLQEKNGVLRARVEPHAGEATNSNYCSVRNIMHLCGDGRERLPGPVHLLQNLRGRLRPDERPGVLVVGLDVLLQARFEVGDGVEDAAADPLLRQRAEEALDQVQPRGARRDEVEVHTLRAPGPLPDLAVLVGRVVVEDDVDLLVLRHLPLDLAEEPEKLLVPVPHRWSHLPTYYLPAAGIHALAGHPFVFNEVGDPVEIVHRDPELTLQEKNGVLRARVEPHAGEATNSNYHIFTASDVRIEVTRFTAGHRKLCEAIPPGGVEVPVEARERLVDAVSALADEMRVQGAIGFGAHAARQTEADPLPWVRLEPSGPGLTVALLVEPVPDSGTYFQPGIGGTTAFASLGGEAVQATRDLDTETRAARELMLACPALSAVRPDWSLVLPEPADCLELVDQLERANARCLWPKGQPFRVVARADAGSLRLSVKTAADWFSASGALDIDNDHSLELRRLFELIDQSPSSRFVPLGEGAFVSLTASFRQQLADLRSVSTLSGKKRIRLHGLAALTLRDFFDGTQLTADGGWQTQRRKFREAETFEPGTPGTLQAELRPYQEDGFAWLARLSRWGAGACLADDMGLGKTVQTLAVLLERATDGPALVVAPTSVVANWLDEARRFAPTLNVRAYTGPAASRAKRLEGLASFDVVVTTYGLLHNDIEALAAVDWSTAVLDEAQAIKNPATKRAQAARKLGARFRLVTTGTPIQNNVVDLYSLFSFLNPGMLGSLKRFRENFAVPIERDRDPAARTRLRRLIAPFVLRRVKADVLDDLPPRTDVTLHVEMSPEEAALYEALRQRAMEDLEALASKDSESESGGHQLQVLAHLTRLRLACCNPRLVHPGGPPSSKLKTFATTLDELRQSRHKVLVFSQFVRHLKLIEDHLIESGIPYQYLDGSTPAKARAERIAAFQAGEGDAFLISLKAGGVGLNLTAADYVIHMDPWWNPAAEDQASDRAHRIGQTRPVTVYRLVTKGTIEEQIVALHRHKRELADRLLEGSDAPARLSTDELLGLVRG